MEILVWTLMSVDSYKRGIGKEGGNKIFTGLFGL